MNKNWDTLIGENIEKKMNISKYENSYFLWSDSLSTSLSTNLFVDWPSKVNPTEKFKSLNNFSDEAA